ncbi:NADH-quinone oxidoreductase subunit NuoK [Ornithinicoccus halotolerans]|uniref:NADH-quinone oxidoreductase subunit NuoK n=1 Tax=Ornithinicoccus halotolerans TaxID=1748220 RepID=UPI0012964DC8|nr:NADH-quinone oxidoreductase subunit NuoK [Ornithinicoccus halotolerans]
MISPALPLLLAAVLAGAGTYGVLARRHLVLVVVGVELLLAAAGMLLVMAGQLWPDPLASGQVLTLFVITVAAAEVVVALAVVLALYRSHGHLDATRPAAREPAAGSRPGSGDDVVAGER